MGYPHNYILPNKTHVDSIKKRSLFETHQYMILFGKTTPIHAVFYRSSDMIKDFLPGLMALIGSLLGVYLTQRGNRKNNLMIKQFDIAKELEKKYMIEPAISFIDKDLKLMQKIYEQIFKSENLNHDLSSSLYDHISDLPSLEARIKVIDNSSLSMKFREFSSIRINIKASVDEDEGKQAFNDLQTAIELAKDIFILLLRDLKKPEVS
jgi:hypothetical protein